MMTNMPNSTAILNGSRSTTGTVLTIPANTFFSLNIAITATVALAGSSNPRVTINGSGGSHASGSELLGVNVTGLLSATSSGNNETEVCGFAGENDLTIQFTAGAAGSSACWVNGYYI